MDYQTRLLEIDDYFRGYLPLMAQLSKLNYESITLEQFKNQYNKLNLNTISSRSLIYVIEDNNKIVASGTILIEYKFIRDLGSVGHIEDIVVDSNYRNKGLGIYLINFLINLCEQLGCYKIILDCSNDLKKFYTNKCGLEEKDTHMVKYFSKL